ncbi:HrpA-like RNA helicase [Natronospira proteinivora]|uniref:HrpA-like RNA helicase n=1 Tax=Natronospira proteinivora TaxID=1807133 RepID=A0ABT1G9X7_9GAMM|nr:helicase-related protein [Natronospira proteinivora]MCP1726742.1 HrpA-like RNA helicase [Natronospira proteinivora]
MSDTLPIDNLENDFRQALETGHVVVSAATGSGKSTRLPLWCRQAGRVLVIEPRRVACTALATFLAESLGQRPGQSVGYAIRFDSCFGPETEVVFVTPGIALRWLAEDGLANFAVVMLDEFHERRWDTDLLLALLKARRQHHLVATSATLSGPALADYLDARVLEAEGRSYPVSVNYVAGDVRGMPDKRGLEARTRAAVERALSETDGDVLVFLPGRGEIQSVQAALGGLDAECLTLHAGVPANEQQRALKPGRGRRIILATNVAETSLTIPAVTAVVDAGLERRTARRNNRTVLQLAPIAQANAEQRRGRAGRVAPGHCYRLWGRQAPLDSFRPPEIQREDLTEMMLAAASAGYRLASLSFPDRLPERALTTARARLESMGAVDQEGRITAHGRALFALPIDTLFAHLISAMPDESSRAAMVDLTAALNVSPPLMRLPEAAVARVELADWQPLACDATTLLAVIRGRAPESLNIRPGARKEARRLAEQMRMALGLPRNIPEVLTVDRAAWLKAMAKAAPELLYVRRQRRPSAMGNGWDEVIIDERSRMEDEALAALVLDDHSVPGKRGTRETRTLATCLAPVPLSLIQDLDLGQVTLDEVRLESGEPRVRERREYAGRTVAREETRPSGTALRQAVAELVLADRMLIPAGSHLKEDLQQWALYVALGKHRESMAPDMPDQPEVPEVKPWLIARLETLGLNLMEDLALIEPDDLKFKGIPDWEREAFDRQYPARFFLGDLVLRVLYDVSRKQIMLEPESGQRKTVPKRWELPAWSGWEIQYRRDSKVEDVR